MIRAHLIARVNCLWCFAQFPVTLRGTILPRSVMNRRSLSMSFGSTCSTLSEQNWQTFGLRRVRFLVNAI